MKNIFLILSSLIISLTVSAAKETAAKETWVVKNMPEVKYVFRNVNGNSTGSKAAATAAELVAEAKKLQLVHSKTIFHKLDLAKKTSTEVGLEVSGPNLVKVPAATLRTRPAGKYLIGHYTGKLSRRLFQSLVPTFKAKKLTPQAPPTAYTYSKAIGTENETLIIVIPLR